MQVRQTTLGPLQYLCWKLEAVTERDVDGHQHPQGSLDIWRACSDLGNRTSREAGFWFILSLLDFNQCRADTLSYFFIVSGWNPSANSAQACKRMFRCPSPR